MTDTPDTSPEAVERFKFQGMAADDEGMWVRYSDYAALSAERDAAQKLLNKAEDWMNRADDDRLAQKTRAESAEAERDALRAELEEAVGVAARLADWIEYETGCDLPFDARAFIARHQKETEE